MYEIILYDTEDGKCPMQELLDSLEPKLLAKTLRSIDLLEKKAMLTGKNTKENQALYQWEDFANSIRYQSIVPMVMQTTYKEFFPEFTQFVTKLDSIKGAIKS